MIGMRGRYAPPPRPPTSSGCSARPATSSRLRRDGRSSPGRLARSSAMVLTSSLACGPSCRGLLSRPSHGVNRGQFVGTADFTPDAITLCQEQRDQFAGPERPARADRNARAQTAKQSPGGGAEGRLLASYVCQLRHQGGGTPAQEWRPGGLGLYELPEVQGVLGDEQG